MSRYILSPQAARRTVKEIEAAMDRAIEEHADGCLPETYGTH